MADGPRRVARERVSIADQALDGGAGEGPRRGREGETERGGAAVRTRVPVEPFEQVERFGAVPVPEGSRVRRETGRVEAGRERTTLPTARLLPGGR